MNECIWVFHTGTRIWMMEGCGGAADDIEFETAPDYCPDCHKKVVVYPTKRFWIERVNGKSMLRVEY